MKENSSGNKHRIGMYKCPSCGVEAVLFTHNVKKQEQRAEASGKPATCMKCMLLARNTGSNKRIKQIPKSKMTTTPVTTSKSKTTVVSGKRSKYRNVVWDAVKNQWDVNVPIPGKPGEKEHLGLFDCEESAQDSIIEYLSHFDNNFL